MRTYGYMDANGDFHKSEQVRTGTLACLLFGHKFIAYEYDDVKCEYSPSGYKRVGKKSQIDFCTRCGIDKTVAPATNNVTKPN